MNDQAIREAAAILWQSWSRSTRIGGLPARCRPADRIEGYAIQNEVARLSGQRVVGWKIAATSKAGQAHIAVDGPLAGRLLSGRLLDQRSPTVPLHGNIMKVAEVEFAFRIGQALPKKGHPYEVEEVLYAVESLHPAIEVPDSRYEVFVSVGAAQLIADMACACWFILGRETSADWRKRDLVSHTAAAYRNGDLVAEGSGANVLGDPRIALTWIANELNTYGDGLALGDVVTTGTCVTPIPVASGDRIRADFGDFGTVDANFS
jgi:2-keto-4-pentenoate hydratase